VAHGRAKLRRRACAFVSCTSELEFGEEPPLNSIAFCADCEESPRGLKPHSFAGFSARLKPCPVTKYFGVRDLYASRARAAHGRAKLRRRMCAFSFCTSELEFGEEPPLSSIAFCSDCQESPQGLKPALFAGFTARLKPCPVTKPLGVRDLYASRARAAHGRAKLRLRAHSTRPLARTRSGQAVRLCFSHVRVGVWRRASAELNCFLRGLNLPRYSERRASTALTLAARAAGTAEAMAAAARITAAEPMKVRAPGRWT
jgi:hypothetical protein